MSLFLQKTDSLENALQVPVIWITTSNRPDLADSGCASATGHAARHVRYADSGRHAVGAAQEDPSRHAHGSHGRIDEAARVACIQQILGYLIGPQPRQEVAQVTLMNGKR